MAGTPTMSSAPANTPVTSDAAGILAEVTDFETQCQARYAFNNRWDVVLIVSGIALGIGVVAGGLSERQRRLRFLAP